MKYIHKYYVCLKIFYLLKLDQFLYVEKFNMLTLQTSNMALYIFVFVVLYM